MIGASPLHLTLPAPMTSTAAGRSRLAAAVLALAAAWPAEARAQAWRDQITRQLDNSSLVEDLRERGYVQTFAPRIELVAADARTEISVELERGRAYSFVGKCDNDCSDLDLRLYDAGGTLLDSDVEMDDHPIISATPTRSGRHTLVVTMADCSTSRCGWGVVGLGEARREITPVQSSSSSTSSWREQIQRQLATSSLVAGWKAEGFRESHDTFYDLVARDASTSVTLRMEAGRTYQLIGKCDNDCTDLDFHLYDEDDDLVDSDVQDDDVPIVRVTPRRAGSYRLRVTMAKCSVSQCGWGVMVLAQ